MEEAHGGGLAGPVTFPAAPHAAVGALYTRHHVHLVRLAALLLNDRGRGEEIVQDAFIALLQHWGRLRDREQAAGYLRTSVVNGALSELRHQRVVRGYRPDILTDAASAESDALAVVQHGRVMEAVNALPGQQRSVLILRYYGQLSEAEIAVVLGISRGTVKSHSSRGLRSLRPRLAEVIQ